MRRARRVSLVAACPEELMATVSLGDELLGGGLKAKPSGEPSGSGPT